MVTPACWTMTVLVWFSLHIWKYALNIKGLLTVQGFLYDHVNKEVGGIFMQLRKWKDTQLGHIAQSGRKAGWDGGVCGGGDYKNTWGNRGRIWELEAMEFPFKSNWDLMWDCAKHKAVWRFMINSHFHFLLIWNVWGRSHSHCMTQTFGAQTNSCNHVIKLIQSFPTVLFHADIRSIVAIWSQCSMTTHANGMFKCSHTLVAPIKPK